MTEINVHEAKAHLSRYLKRAEKGEKVVICRRNRPVVELRPVARPSARKPRIGIYKGKFTVPASFFEPLPDEIQRYFEGRGD